MRYNSTVDHIVTLRIIAEELYNTKTNLLCIRALSLATKGRKFLVHFVVFLKGKKGGTLLNQI
jgi:hypothetical protein